MKTLTQTRTGRSALGMLATLTFTAVTTLVAFKTTPLLLQWLGATRFGAFKAISEWFAYLPLLEFGLGGSLMACLAPAIGRGDDDAVCRIMTAGFRAYWKIVPLVVLSGVGLAMLLPRIPSFRAVGSAELAGATLILVAPALWNPFAVYRILADARQMLYVISATLTVQALLTIAMLLIAARAGWGLIGQSVGIVLGQTPSLLVLVWVGRRAYPRALRAARDESISRQIWALNWPTFIFSITGRLSLLSDNMVIALFLGPAMVGPFYLTQRLAILAQAQLLNIGNSTWAGLVELHAQGRLPAFRARMLELTGATSGLAIAVLGPIAVFNEAFVVRWIGAGNYAGGAVTWLISVNSWLLAIFGLWGWPISGTGNIRMWVRYAVAFAAVNVSASIAATIWLGIAGPLVGTTVSFLAVTAWAMPRVLDRLFGLRPGDLWGVALKPLAWGIPYVFAVWSVARFSAPADLIRVIAAAGISMLGGVLCWWRFGMSRESRSQWIGRLRVAAGV